MAEPVGLAIGVVSLAAIFSTCIELAEYIQPSRDLGKDFEIAYTRFLLVKSRLNAFDQVIEGQFASLLTTEDEVVLKRSLSAIEALLQTAGRFEERYGLQQRNDNEIAQTSAMQEVERVLSASAGQSQARTSFRRKVVWAIKDNKAFEKLISQFAFLVNELESIAKRLGLKTFQRLPVPDLASVSPRSVALLQAAVAEPDVSFEPPSRLGTATVQTATPKFCSEGHQYLRTVIADRARVNQGDVGEVSSNSRSHTYWDTKISGDARLVQGNISGADFRGFWN